MERFPTPRTVDLSRFDSTRYDPGRPRAIQILWFALGLPLLRSSWIPSSGFRRVLLRLFGARVGTGVVCKPGMRVKFPWRLTVKDHAWIGEDCWIDNLADVTVGQSCCLSQGSYLCTGNHDWTDERFALMLGEIHLEDGSWIGARATVLPGVTIHLGGIAAAGSVVSHDIPPQEIHAGNPARFLRRRTIRDGALPRSPEVTV